MALVTTTQMFKKAYEGGYAVGAFNVNNMEIIQGIVEAAEEEQAPVILQVSSGARKYANPVYLRKLVEAAIEVTGLDICLHLDHGADFEICKACVDSGFSSVMIDGSKHGFEENIALTKKVVEYAHDHGVVVEAELGKLAGVEDAVHVLAHDATYTDPDEAVEFVERTGCDSLAVAIGTSHGAYKFTGDPQLDFERLDKISSLLPGFPLVLHGASSVPKEFVDLCNQYGGQIPGAQGVPESMLRKAAKSGVCKINIDTDLRLAMTASIRRIFVENPGWFDPREYLGPGRTAIKAMVAHKIKNVLGASNQR
ncbi:MAG: class II fructose-1,6-bisphosphate aldolase [Eubacteriaceae bacterium]